MVNASPRCALGQSEAALAVRNERPDPPPRKKWYVRVPVDFLDARRKDGGIGPRNAARRLRLILEGCCRDKAYCWFGDDELAAMYGCKRSALQGQLKELEDDGIIHRVPPEEKGDSGRLGIIMLRRIDEDLPTARPEEIPDVIALMKRSIASAREKKSGPTVSGKAGRPCPEKWARTVSGKTGAELRRCRLKKDEEKKDPPNPRGDLFSLSTNDNDRTPDPEPEPQAPVTPPAEAIVEDLPAEPAPIVPALQADPVPEVAGALVEVPELPPPPAMAFDPARGFVDSGSEAAPSRPSAPCPAPPRPAPRPMASRPAAAGPKAESPELTDGQRDWLESLTAEQRTAFDGKSPKAQALLLAPHTKALNLAPIIVADQAEKLAPHVAVAVDVPMPVTVEDAVEAIVGGYRPAPAMLATLLAREFDDQKSWPFFNQLGGRLLENPCRADDFFNGLRQARNPKAKNPGAVLVKALKRDHRWRFKTP